MFTTDDDVQQQTNLAEEPNETTTTPPSAPPSLFSTNDRRKKRKSGRSGPTSAAGRAISSRNAIKHGACSQTLILKGESEASWLLLLEQWCQTYNIAVPPADDDDHDENTEADNPENSLTYSFVLKTAQAEWRRIRCQRNFDNYLALHNPRSPINWSPEELNMHNLLLRYQNAAERSFQREIRTLEQHCKIHQEKPAAAPPPKTNPKQPQAQPQPEPAPRPASITLIGEDPDSPTGYSILKQIENGREVVENRGQPFTPPDPLPPNWRKFHYPPTKPEPAPK